jgi:hypothetical protein
MTDKTTANQSITELPVFGTTHGDKRRILLEELNALTRLHRDKCKEYASILRARGQIGDAASIEDIPFLPVRLFKSHLLSSTPQEDVVKVLTSSGTTGQRVSRIVLDKDTAMSQSRTLVRIMQNFLGKQRLPMLIVDHESVIKDRNSFSARGAGIRGMANFGRDHLYALRDQDMSLDREKLEAWLEKHRGMPVLIFGFTFMVWEYFVQPLHKSGKPLNFEGYLVHSGGWKKLIDRAVSNEDFKSGVAKACGVAKVHNFYGMVEQVGSVFVECSQGRLHAPVHADVLFRSPFDWSIVKPGDRGLIQVLSALPRSYPGHSLLTEDEGSLIGEDDCPCGLKGKTFKVHGRLAAAEARGCSDTHEQPVAA